MTEPYPPPTPEERQLRAQRLAASGGPPPGPPVANPLSAQSPGGGLRGQTAGVPNYIWLIGIVGIAVVGFILWRKNQAANSANNSTITAANPNSPVDASTAGLATDQYESLLALLRDQQGAASQILTTEQQEPAPGSGPAGPAGPTGPTGPTGATGAPGPAAPPAPKPAPSPSAPPSTPHTYRVSSGDTLGGIASRFGTSWQTLYSMNRNVINNEAAAHGYYSNQWDHIWPQEVLVVP